MHTATKLAITGLATLGVAAVGVGAALATTTTTTPPPSRCVTTVTHLNQRPDSGSHGNNWALDTFTRTVKICATPPAPPSPTPSHSVTLNNLVIPPVLWKYHADVTDVGTFTTIPGEKYPGHDTGIFFHKITGKMTGGFTEDFTALPNFQCFNNTYGGDTYHGTAPGSSGNWVENDWNGKCKVNDLKTSGMNNDWTWTYTTCAEKWIDAADNNYGGNIADGNITNESWKKCHEVPSPHPSVTCTVKPSPSASVSPSGSASPSSSVKPSTSVSPSHTASPTPSSSSSTTAVVLAGDTGTSGRLPTTGAPTGYILGLGLFGLGAGIGALYLTRRHRAANS